MGNRDLSEDGKKAQRRWASEQSLASARIEGFVPTADFLADCEAYVEGTMTNDEAGERCLQRALAQKAERDLERHHGK